MNMLLSIAFSLLLGLNVADEPKPLAIGDKAPAFEARNQQGELVSLEKLLKKGPVVLFFYRGQWCSYCNRQMSQLQDSLSFLTNKGATVVGISPEILENIQKSVSKSKATFSVLSDVNHAIMDAYKVSFQLNANTLEKYKGYGIDLNATNGNADNTLPVPATYIIGKDGKIRFAYFDTDYKQRVSVKTLLQQL